MKKYEAKVASNIAFIKYWGKEDEALQWPANDSISMTLDGLHTLTRCSVSSDEDHLFLFNGEKTTRQSKQGAKAFKHLDFLQKKYNFNGSLRIESKNSFPTGCGIASSASGLAALTLSAISAWTDSSSFSELEAKGFSKELLSNLSRMGSGSAGRSLFGGYVKWNKADSADNQFINQEVSEDNWELCDSVVLFSSSEKAVGSTEAHRAAWSSPLFAPRLASLTERMQVVTKALQDKDMKMLGDAIEAEALEMHAVIMSASPSVHYFGKETGEFLAKMRKARKELQLPMYFTIDAGPNVHVIYPKDKKDEVRAWLESQIKKENLLHDSVGHGAQIKVVDE